MTGVRIHGNTFAVTGGASLLGRHLMTQLIEAGASRIVLIDNFSLGSPESLQAGLPAADVEVINADIRDGAGMRTALQRVDGVFHAAAYLTLPLSENPLLGLNVNIQGTGTVLAACVDTGVRKLILSSSVAVYGNSSSTSMSENTCFDREGLQPAAAMYGASKIVAESLAHDCWVRQRLPYVALRLSSLYGEHQHGRGVNSLHLWDAYHQLSAGKRPKIIGDGEEVHDYLYVGDAARAHIVSMESDVSGEAMTVATGLSTSLNDAVRQIAQICGRDFDPDYYEADSKVRFMNSSTLQYNVSKAETLLGWTPKTDLSEGLRKLAAWSEEASNSDNF